MTPAYFRELYDYCFWSDRRVWDSVAALSDAQIAQPNSYSRGTILAQCFHILAVEWWWIHFLSAGELVFLDAEDFPTRADVRQKWDEVETHVRAYLDALTEDELQRPVKPDFWDEDEEPVRVYQALTQVAFHSADHRSQVLAQIHLLGGPTFEQDFLNYLDEKN